MQLRMSKTINFFEERLRQKFNFEKYESNQKPTLFFGVYRHNDFKEIEKHKGKKIVWFAGTDSLLALNSFRKGNTDIKRYLKDATVIAGSEWIGNDLKEMGIKYKFIALFIDNIYNWRTEPLGDSLYWYGGRNRKYGKEYLRDIQRAIPDLDIIIHDQKNIPHNEMAEVYKKCFAGIRPVEHDGSSQTVGELGLMGRKTIWNGVGPFAVNYKDVNDMIEAIKVLRCGYNEKLISKRTIGYLVEQEAKWTDLVLNLCGVDELDYAGIFNEDIGRCGSIFRIQRKSDIEKIGLGDGQYNERSSVSNGMIKLGKKQLITTKNSGFVINEWKNSDKRKGYPKGVTFLTHDRGTI